MGPDTETRHNLVPVTQLFLSHTALHDSIAPTPQQWRKFVQRTGLDSYLKSEWLDAETGRADRTIEPTDSFPLRGPARGTIGVANLS